MKTAIFLRCSIAVGCVIASCNALSSAPVVVPLRTLDLSVTTPGRVAADSSGGVYLCDPSPGNLYQLDAFGRTIRTNSTLGRPCAVAVQGSSTVLVGDANLGRVLVMDRSITSIQGVLGQVEREFLLPGGIASWDTNGTIWVADGLANQVKVYANSVRVLTIGSRGAGPGQFDFPSAICISPAGEALVLDQNNDRVQRFDATGTWLGSFPLADPAVKGRSGRGQGIACDGLGRVYVADSFQGLIRVYSPAGLFLRTVGSYGQLLGQFELPMDLCVDAQNRLWVANTGNRRVDVFGIDCHTDLVAAPARQVVGIGTTVTFSVAQGCAAEYTYQWSKDGQVLINGGSVSGAATAQLRLAGVLTTDSGNYSVQVSRNGSPSLSAVASLVVVANLLQGFLPEGLPEPELGPPLVAEPETLAVMPPVLTIEQRPDGDMVLNWENAAYVLESAPDPAGPFEPVMGGEAPCVVARDEVESTPARYYRLRLR